MVVYTPGNTLHGISWSLGWYNTWEVTYWTWLLMLNGTFTVDSYIYMHGENRVKYVQNLVRAEKILVFVPRIISLMMKTSWFLVLGMANTAGTLAAIIGTVGAGFFVELVGSFQGFLLLTSLLYFLAALFYCLFSTGERVNFDDPGEYRCTVCSSFNLRIYLERTPLVSHLMGGHITEWNVLFCFPRFYLFAGTKVEHFLTTYHVLSCHVSCLSYIMFHISCSYDYLELPKKSGTKKNKNVQLNAAWEI